MFRASFHRYDLRIECPVGDGYDYAQVFQSYLAQDDDDLADQVRIDYPDLFGYDVVCVHLDVITMEDRIDVDSTL